MAKETVIEIIPQVLRLHSEFRDIQRVPTARRGESWQERVRSFHRRISSSLFDIACGQNRRRRQEIFYGVKMTGVEYDFLEDQRGPRKQYCDDVVDKQWKKTAERKAKEEESFRRREERARQEAKRKGQAEVHNRKHDSSSAIHESKQKRTGPSSSSERQETRGK